MDRHTHVHYQRNSCWAMICDHPHCWRTSGTLSLSVSLVYWTSHFYAKHQIFLRPYILSKIYYPFRPLSHPNCYQSLSGLLPPPTFDPNILRHPSFWSFRQNSSLGTWQMSVQLCSLEWKWPCLMLWFYQSETPTLFPLMLPPTSPRQWKQRGSQFLNTDWAYQQPLQC